MKLGVGRVDGHAAVRPAWGKRSLVSMNLSTGQHRIFPQGLPFRSEPFFCNHVTAAFIGNGTEAAAIEMAVENAIASGPGP